MVLSELLISGKEQKLIVGAYSVALYYNPFDMYWYYDVYEGETLIVSGLSLDIGSMAYGCLGYMRDFPFLVLVDKTPEDKTPYNPYGALGDRLGLYQITKE